MSQNPKSALSSTGADFVPTIHHDTYPRITPTQWNLEGKTVLVTGASKGVGRATALSFARAGASSIALAARSQMKDLATELVSAAQEAGKPAPKVLALAMDVQDQASVENAAKEITGAFGRLDVLVNNAGYLEEFLPVGESKVEEWRRVWEVNVMGVYMVTRAFLGLMVKRGGGTVVNLSSVGANFILPGASGYQMGKLAILRFSEFLNAEYGDKGILSYSVHPGGVATELALNMPKEAHAWLTDTPELAGDAIVWLTAERRDWLAGRYISVTWDVDEFLGKKEKIVEQDLLKTRLDVGLD